MKTSMTAHKRRFRNRFTAPLPPRLKNQALKSDRAAVSSVSASDEKGAQLLKLATPPIKITPLRFDLRLAITVT